MIAAAVAADRMTRPKPADEFLTPAAVASQLGGMKVEGVLEWIHDGSLRAVNTSKGKRPTWKISPEDLAAFLEKRKSGPREKPVKRRMRSASAVTKYF
jgi:Helix-turn-helix domain